LATTFIKTGCWQTIWRDCGESESRLRQMISVAETISPVFWIDEIDKAFTNTESRGDSGTSNRVSHL
jgi:SpoVK/Ycf46/Vps4 family AAA+-type ATPase